MSIVLRRSALTRPQATPSSRTEPLYFVTALGAVETGAFGRLIRLASN